MKELTAGKVKIAMHAAAAGSGDLWKIPPAAIRVLPDFNVRVKDQVYKDRVRWIADSIKANGYMMDRALTGYAATVEGEDVIYVTDGHRRLEAALLAISEGYPLEALPMIVPKGRTMADVTADLVTSNSGENLTPYETGMVCKRLLGLGLADTAAVAARLGFASAQYVDGLLLLVSAPLPVRNMVTEGVVSATVAIDTLKKHGDKAQDVLLGAVVKAGTGKRVTASALPGAAFAKALRKQAEPMYHALEVLAKDPAFSKLSPDVQSLVGLCFEAVKKISPFR